MSETKTTVHTGSCHCGKIQYQVRVALPASDSANVAALLGAGKVVSIYKCNCSTCHKMGLFHMRPRDPPADFVLMAPAPPSELGEYRCFSKKIGWYFCTTCGVRPFGMGGAWVDDEVDLDEWAGRGPSGKKTKVWKVKSVKWTMEQDGQTTSRDLMYLSINAVTLDYVPKETDLKMWHEKGWIAYINIGEDQSDRHRFGTPYPGGMY